MSLAEKIDEIRSSIFRIETTWDDGKKGHAGTAFVVDRKCDAGNLILATAKHLLLGFSSAETVTWRAQQFDAVGEVERGIGFQTNASLTADVPYRTHNELDVGFCMLPAAFGDGKPFARDDERPPRMIKPPVGASAGTEVAWAGFPSLVENELGHPQLCCFAGIISAMVHGEGRRQIYVVDGHAAAGVSGGPVWQWNEKRLEVVGIISSYLRTTDAVPGFLMVEPINPVTDYLEEWRKKGIGPTPS